MTTCMDEIFTVRVFRKRISVCVYPSSLFGFEGGMWNLTVLIPDHCVSIYSLAQ